ncbi:MAG: oxidoreductase [Bdellovibrionales bacterium RIFOXYC1_FULL_54_43]|nr:MAG: oxidoreductase [Bdellovibrionales bacterium RIFOXYC1_FULL_54_43]OFZ82292.1 MAG: oxidoreductase [Bdellovibrionales bacterium RIFOXYD1_FULL_55_31]
MKETELPRRPKLGFLGVGWIGRHRMQAIHSSGVAEVSMIHDPSPERITEALKCVPGAKEARSFQQMLNAGLDGIVIATPSALHSEQAIRALESGISVFSQKPLGRKRNEVRAVVDAARASDRLLGVDLSYRFTEAVTALRERLQNNDIGQVFMADLVFHNAYGPDKSWFYQPELSGGGCLIDLGVHLLDLALWNLGFPNFTRVASQLYSGGRPLRHTHGKVEDYATATLELESGASVQISCSWNLPAGCDAMISATFYGTKGGLALRNVNGSFYDFIAERYQGTKREILVSPPDDWGGRAAVNWARQLSLRARFNEESEQFVRVAEAMDAIYATQ